MFDQLAVFCAVAETKGFSAAARRLEMSKSAVSKGVQKLEDSLGVRLFHRTTRKVTLTEAGETYYQHARLAVQQVQAAADAVASLSQEPRGRLRMTAPMSLGLARISDLVSQFLRSHPGIEVELHLDDRRVDMIAGGFDLAIRVGDLPDSSMVARPIGTMPAVLVASPAYLDAHPEPETPEDLVDHECLLYAYHFDANQWTFRKGDDERRVRVGGRLQINSSIALRCATLHGLGVCRIPAYLVEDDLRAGKLIRLLSSYTMDNAVIHAVFPERGFIPAKVRLLVDYLADGLGDQEG